MCKKANQTLNFLQRNLRGCHKSIKAKAYNIYVQHIVNYASTAWNPVNNQSLTKQLEQVQRKAARFVCSNWSWESSPSEMIRTLGWKSLGRKQSSLVMLHKINNDHIAMPKDFLPKRSRVSGKFQQVLGRVLAYSNSFIPVATKWWNELPKSLIDIQNQKEFINKLSDHMKT